MHLCPWFDTIPDMVQIAEMTELDRKLAKAAKECSADAVRRTFAAGLPITILDGNRIVRRWEDGREELVKELPPR